MTQLLRRTILLAFLFILWVLTRGLQFVFELSGLSDEACEISNSELGLQCRIRKLIKEVAPGVVWGR